MIPIRIYQLIFLTIALKFSLAGRIYTRKVFHNSGSIPIHRSSVVRTVESNNNLPIHNQRYSQKTYMQHPIQNTNRNIVVSSSNNGDLFNRLFTSGNAESTLPREILENLPPGASVSISTKINFGEPGKSISKIQTHGRNGTALSIQTVPRFSNMTFLSNGNGWKSFQRTWSQTAPVPFVRKPIVSKTVSTLWTPNVQNISMNKIFDGTNPSSLIPKEFLENLPPGAHVKFSASSSIIPEGRISVHSSQSGTVSQTGIFSDYGNQNRHKLHRNLPQPRPSLKPGEYCGETLCEEDKYLLLKEHNRVRRFANPEASNMKKIIWDVELEKSAQNYAKTCLWKHDTSRSNNSPYSYVGQNMNARRASRNVLSATQRWEREQDNYNIYTGYCVPGKLCGHYTQMVWANTETVGCGMWKCPYINNLGWRDAYLIVCNYGPGGNIGGQKPYIIGNNCSNCPETKPKCVNGLCV